MPFFKMPLFKILVCPVCSEKAVVQSNSNSINELSCSNNHKWFNDKKTGENYILHRSLIMTNSVTNKCPICNGLIVLSTNSHPMELFCENHHRIETDGHKYFLLEKRFF